jgi:hypothetical protein
MGERRIAVTGTLCSKRPAGLAGFLLLVVTYVSSCGPLPQDKTLISNFQKHQSQFEQLVRMSDEDSHVVLIRYGFTRLDSDWSWPRKNIGISQERWAQYKGLFDETRSEGGIERYVDAGRVFVAFDTVARGTSLAETVKGYVYCGDCDSLKPKLESLDGPLPERAAVKDQDGHVTRYEAYRRISDHWFLFLWEDS